MSGLVCDLKSHYLLVIKVVNECGEASSLVLHPDSKLRNIPYDDRVKLPCDF